MDYYFTSIQLMEIGRIWNYYICSNYIKYTDRTVWICPKRWRRSPAADSFYYNAISNTNNYNTYSTQHRSNFQRTIRAFLSAYWEKCNALRRYRCYWYICFPFLIANFDPGQAAAANFYQAILSFITIIAVNALVRKYHKEYSLF